MSRHVDSYTPTPRDTLIYSKSHIDVQKLSGRWKKCGYDEGKSNEAKFDWPISICFRVLSGSTDAEMFICDRSNHCIRKVNTEDGSATLFCGVPVENGFHDGALLASKFHMPSSIVWCEQNSSFFVADRENHVIRRIIQNEDRVETVCGLPGKEGFKDGDSREARFYRPTGVVVDSKGETLFVCDRENHAIRRVNLLTLQVDTLCGSSQKGKADGIGTKAEFKVPITLCFDLTGANLFVCDSKNYAIRKVNIETREVSTILSGRGHEDGKFSRSLMDEPASIVMDKNGVLLIADCYNQCVRKVVIDKSGTDGQGMLFFFKKRQKKLFVDEIWVGLKKKEKFSLN